MSNMDKHRTGLTVGALFGLWHLAWSLLVALGWAQPVMNWGYGMHFLNSPHMVGQFNLGGAAGLVVMAALIGYAIGWVFAAIWNAVQKKS